MRVLLCLLAAATVAACGGGGGGSSTNYNTPTNPNPPNNPPSQPPANSVQVADNSYTPGDITVAVGATVTWSWGNGYSAHSVTWDDGSGGSGNLTSGTYAKTFNTAGKFNYHCAVHGAAIMSGSVTVQ